MFVGGRGGSGEEMLVGRRGGDTEQEMVVAALAAACRSCKWCWAAAAALCSRVLVRGGGCRLPDGGDAVAQPRVRGAEGPAASSFGRGGFGGFGAAGGLGTASPQRGGQAEQDRREREENGGMNAASWNAHQSNPGVDARKAFFQLPWWRPLEGQLGDPGFIELAQALEDHLVVLGLGGLGERELEKLIPREEHGDGAVLGRMGGAEETAMVAVLHVLPIRDQHARGGAGLAEDFADHGEIEAERIRQAEPFGEAGRC